MSCITHRLLWPTISHKLEELFLPAEGVLKAIAYKHMEIGDVCLGENCIQNFHLGRYIVGYTVGNLVLRWRLRIAVKHDFRMYIRRYTSPNENLNMVIPILMHYLNFSL